MYTVLKYIYYFFILFGKNVDQEKKRCYQIKNIFKGHIHWAVKVSGNNDYFKCFTYA